jgi:hypothetical protein
MAVSTLIHLLKPNFNWGVPELFCECLDNFINKYQHIKIITGNFTLFIETLSDYLLHYKWDYQLYSDIYYAVLANKDKALSISSVDVRLSKPIDVILFDNILPSKYPYGDDISMISMIKSYSAEDNNFYHKIIMSKGKFDINESNAYINYTSSENIYFMDASVKLYKLGNYYINCIANNTSYTEFINISGLGSYLRTDIPL